MHFDGVGSPESSTARIAETKHMARLQGRDVQVWTPVGIICRPSQAEADAYLERCIAHADWGALGHLADLHASDARGRVDEGGVLRRSGEGTIERQVLARGSSCAGGTPGAYANELHRIHRARLARRGLTLV